MSPFETCARCGENNNEHLESCLELVLQEPWRCDLTVNACGGVHEKN